MQQRNTKTFEEEAMKKWEYKTEVVNGGVEEKIAFLNRQGDEGWEFVAIERIGAKECMMVLKREKENP